MILPATRHEIGRVARGLRATDRSELEFNARTTGRWREGWTPEADVMKSAEAAGQVWSMWTGDLLLGIGGVAAVAEGVGAIWFLGNDEADHHWRAMTRMARQFHQSQRRHWAWLGNVVPRSMSQRKRWLTHLGFDFMDEKANQGCNGLATFYSPAPTGPEDGPAAR